jgi:hypothetical protein
MFPDVEFRFVCTATPSPNRYKELIHYAGFLGVMDTGHALTRFFLARRMQCQVPGLLAIPSEESRQGLPGVHDAKEPGVMD